MKKSVKIYAEKLENLEKVIEGKCNKENLEKIIQEKINENNDSLNEKFSEKSEKKEVQKLIEDKLIENDKKLKSYNEVLGKKIESANKVAEEAISAISNSNEELVDKTVQKINEQSERANNIIIFNLEESNAILKDDIIEHDQLVMKEFLKVILPSTNTEEAFLEKPIRMGNKKSDKIRPIKIKFKHLDYKQAFLSNMRNIEMSNNNVLKKCVVAHDLNDLERSHERSLVNEMKKLNVEQNDFLYRVRGPPHDRKLVKTKKK